MFDTPWQCWVPNMCLGHLVAMVVSKKWRSRALRVVARAGLPDVHREAFEHRSLSNSLKWKSHFTKWIVNTLYRPNTNFWILGHQSESKPHHITITVACFWATTMASLSGVQLQVGGATRPALEKGKSMLVFF